MKCNQPAPFLSFLRRVSSVSIDIDLKSQDKYCINVCPKIICVHINKFKCISSVQFVASTSGTIRFCVNMR